jgi:hypothetical protein
VSALSASAACAKDNCIFPSKLASPLHPAAPLISCQDQAHVFAVCCAAVVCFLTHILAFLLFSRYVIIKCFSSLYLSSKKQVVLASIMMMSPAFDLFRL